MNAIVKLYSNNPGEISMFLTHFFEKEITLDSDLFWQKEYLNPVELSDIITALIENVDDYSITMWISLDKDVFINITQNNADDIVRYLFERYPY